MPGLAWNASQTAAHVVGDLREYTEALTNHVNGYRVSDRVVDRPPWRLRAAVNARHLTAVPERDLWRLADMLEDTAVHYLAAAATIDASQPAAIATADGLVLEPAFMTCLLLGEQLVHGLDIARPPTSRGASAVTMRCWCFPPCWRWRPTTCGPTVAAQCTSASSSGCAAASLSDGGR
ncbi:hypothetical protein I552_6191 [Mycobacterium xenopi 3993]|nr:hypothetical protein I552_6191 [Mycobacterium xenopi 3993]